MIFTNTRSIDRTKSNKLLNDNNIFKVPRQRPPQMTKSEGIPSSHNVSSYPPNPESSYSPVPAPIHIVRPRSYLARSSGPVLKKVKWGEPFWNLFHVLSEKIIVDEGFLWKKQQFLNIIFLICKNLPCPDCATHATNYLNGVNFDAIRTKEQLKDFFYNFHNQVNARRGAPIYPRHQLDEKYSKGVTLNILKEFMIHFENKHKSIHMISNDFHRGGVAVVLKKWFNENIEIFEP